MKYCLIGEKLSHSYSEIIHRSMGLDYSLKEIAPKDLEKFVLSKEYDGFNITIPYKKAVQKYLTVKDKITLKIGAVNTAKLRGGVYEGINTDCGGIKYAVSEMGFNPKDKTVVVLGTGGAAVCAKYTLLDMGAKAVYFISRGGKYNYKNYFKYKKYREASLIINASPVGTYPYVENCKIDLTLFANLEGVFDMVYNPSLTDFLERAKSLGLSYSNGLPMLVEQGLLAEDFWLDRKHTKSDTERIIKEIKMRTQNIVLSGMPSCGKSSIGKEVARLSGKTFVDLDEFIFNFTGRTPKEIIETDGENAFRIIERGAAKEIGKRSNQVIALGGGSLHFYDNYKRVKTNGVIAYINRPLELLSVEGRPLSQREGVEKLYNSRKDGYESTADFIVENRGNKSILEVAKEILKGYESACDKRR